MTQELLRLTYQEEKFSDPQFSRRKVKQRLSQYGLRGDRLKAELKYITTEGFKRGSLQQLQERFPYGWERKQLNRYMRRMFKYQGRHVIITFDEYFEFINAVSTKNKSVRHIRTISNTLLDKINL